MQQATRRSFQDILGEEPVCSQFYNTNLEIADGTLWSKVPRKEDNYEFKQPLQKWQTKASAVPLNDEDTSDKWWIYKHVIHTQDKVTFSQPEEYVDRRSSHLPEIYQRPIYRRYDNYKLVHRPAYIYPHRLSQTLGVRYNRYAPNAGPDDLYKDGFICQLPRDDKYIQRGTKGVAARGILLLKTWDTLQDEFWDQKSRIIHTSPEQYSNNLNCVFQQLLVYKEDTQSLFYRSTKWDNLPEPTGKRTYPPCIETPRYKRRRQYELDEDLHG
jgi:hypothetical protein